MSDHILADLDELALQVRDRFCRTYIMEAIAAYRVRAFRASVVSTWVAVAYDIISKIRELSAQGNKSAEVFVADLNRTIATQDKSKSMQIENDLLKTASVKFEFLSQSETEDLERLRADRHRCAHPAFSGIDVLFIPSAELVRAHVVHAINHLLSKPAVHGKAALERMKADILQPSFPADPDRVAEYIGAKYLDHAKPAFIETLVTVLLKVVVRDTDKELAAVKSHVCNCLRAVALRYPAAFEAQARQDFPRLLQDADDSRYGNVFLLFAIDARLWEWLDEPSRMRLRHIAENPPLGSDTFDVPFGPSPSITPEAWLGALDIPELRAVVLSGFDSMPFDTQERFLRESNRSDFNDRAIAVFRRAGGWRHAESLGRGLILPRARSFSPEQVRALLEAVTENNQIWDAADMQAIITEFFHLVRHHHNSNKVDWKNLLAFLASQDRDWSEIAARAQNLP